MNLGFAASSVFGAALAYPLIAFFGLSVALLVDAASFLISPRYLPPFEARWGWLEHTNYQPWHSSLSSRVVVCAFETGSCARCLWASRSRSIRFTVVVPIEVIYAKE